MLTTKDITIEELVEKAPKSVEYLMNAGIKCIACGEPIWGTLEEAAMENFLRSHSDRIGPDTIIFSEARPLRAVCWFYDRTDVYLFEKQGELAFVFEYEDSQHRFMNLDQFKAFVTAPTRTGNVVLIARNRQYQNIWQPHLPDPLFRADSGERGYVFIEYGWLQGGSRD